MSSSNAPRILIAYLILIIFSFSIVIAVLIHFKPESNYPITQLNNTASIRLSSYIQDR